MAVDPRSFTVASTDWGWLKGLDQDDARQLLADGQPHVAHLADKIGLAGEQPDDLVLAKAQLPQAVLEVGGRAQLLNAHCHASLDAAQGTNLTLGVFTRTWFDGAHPIHILAPKSVTGGPR
ncbi:hypothetical protein SBV1_1710031 [Verrucomicrobia bacterium]|nr:hypothetical protein SBV1_1710031 [Verrucomicrobiota bacterium]